MLNLSRLFVITATIAAFGTTAAAAQALTMDRKFLTNYAASQIVASCMAIAARDNANIAIAVVDPYGNLLAFQAAEDTTETGSMTAQLKAKTAARWRRATVELFDRVNNQVNRAPEWVGDFPQPGGFPIYVEGQIVGAVGAGGGVGSVDDECAIAAVEAVFGDTARLARPE